MNVRTAIRADRNELLRAAREEAYSTPLKDFHPGAPRLFQNDTLWPWFERLRKEEPVHYCTNAPIEPYWSVTKYNDIMTVDTSHGIYSSDAAQGGINIKDAPVGYDWPSFITMDQPKHSGQRKTVSPMFTPTHLDELAKLIRARTIKVLDGLPRNETFNWVERVSIVASNKSLSVLRAALSLAFKEGLLAAQPRVELLPEDDARPIVPPTDTELNAILNEARAPALLEERVCGSPICLNRLLRGSRQS